VDHKFLIAPDIKHRNEEPLDVHIFVRLISEFTFGQHVLINGGQDSNQVVEQENVSDHDMDQHPNVIFHFVGIQLIEVDSTARDHCIPKRQEGVNWINVIDGLILVKCPKNRYHHNEVAKRDEQESYCIRDHLGERHQQL